MPGYVQGFVDQQQQVARQAAWDHGYQETRQHLDRDLAERYRNDDYRINGYKPEQWSAEHERIAIQQIAHSENLWIQRAREYTGGPAGSYGEKNFRMGARHAVMDFSREHNHRLLEAIRQDYSIRESYSVAGPRIKI